MTTPRVSLAGKKDKKRARPEQEAFHEEQRKQDLPITEAPEAQITEEQAINTNVPAPSIIGEKQLTKNEITEDVAEIKRKRTQQRKDLKQMAQTVPPINADIVSALKSATEALNKSIDWWDKRASDIPIPRVKANLVDHPVPDQRLPPEIPGFDESRARYDRDISDRLRRTQPRQQHEYPLPQPVRESPGLVNGYNAGQSFPYDKKVKPAYLQHSRYQNDSGPYAPVPPAGNSFLAF